MFDEQRSPQVAPPTTAEIAADTLLLAALMGVARAENQHAYHKVNTAAEFHRRFTRRRTGLPERHATAWSHAAHTEIAIHLACSATTAAQYVEVGLALRERLPRTRAAFAAGDLDYPKARRIATATTGFSDPVTATVEAAALALAERCAPAGFATELEDLLIRTAPDEYAALRKDAVARARRLRRRNRGTTHRIEADLAPHEAAAVWQRIGEVAATVCGHDPRDTRHRLVDAYLAIMHGADHLACTCARGDCTADPTPPSRRTPLVQITVDAPTLLGLRSEPAFLPGHGPIDPELARELATDATWQPILVELVDLPVAAGILTPEQAAAGTAPAEPAVAPDPVADEQQVADEENAANTETAGTEVADASVDAAAPDEDVSTEPEPAIDADTPTEGVGDADPGAEPGPPPVAPDPASPVESVLHTRLCHPLLATFAARGTRRRAGYLPSCAPKPVLVPLVQADLYQRFTDLLATCPEFADGIHPDGHGGLLVPPAGALTYRPGAETAALVRARDRHCRFPHCTMPAARCQLDHIRPFDHRNPRAGGWTIASDLQSLCAFHHALKTAGLWHARALPGTAILWTGPRGDRHLTLPAGELTPVPAATGLTPEDRDDPPF